MTPAGARLDRFLTRAIAAVKGETESDMPEVGATRLSGSIAALFDTVRKKMDEAQLTVVAAATELMAEVNGYDDVAKALRSERDAVRSHVNSLLGNNPPPDKK